MLSKYLATTYCYCLFRLLKQIHQLTRHRCSYEPRHQHECVFHEGTHSSELDMIQTSEAASRALCEFYTATHTDSSTILHKAKVIMSSWSLVASHIGRHRSWYCVHVVTRSQQCELLAGTSSACIQSRSEHGRAPPNIQMVLYDSTIWQISQRVCLLQQSWFQEKVSELCVGSWFGTYLDGILTITSSMFEYLEKLELPGRWESEDERDLWCSQRSHHGMSIKC
jgi:hypothetical protein